LFDVGDADQDDRQIAGYVNRRGVPTPIGTLSY
jgi:hypothetical protein